MPSMLLKNNSSYRAGKISRNISGKSIERLNNDERRELLRYSPSRRITTKRKYYYGLDMFFKYILFTYDTKKALETNKSNITKAIKAYRYILESPSVIKMNDVYFFFFYLLENRNKNKNNFSLN